MDYNFAWDINKAKLNFVKHKIAFDDAASVFNDPRALTIYDEEHNFNEERWITSGISKKGNIIVLVHTFVQIDDDTAAIRIISARKATKKEIIKYNSVNL